MQEGAYRQQRAEMEALAAEKAKRLGRAGGGSGSARAEELDLVRSTIYRIKAA